MSFVWKINVMSLKQTLSGTILPVCNVKVEVLLLSHVSCKLSLWCLTGQSLEIGFLHKNHKFNLTQKSQKNQCTLHYYLYWTKIFQDIDCQQSQSFFRSWTLWVVHIYTKLHFQHFSYCMCWWPPECQVRNLKTWPFF